MDPTSRNPEADRPDAATPASWRSCSWPGPHCSRGGQSRLTCASLLVSVARNGLPRPGTPSTAERPGVLRRPAPFLAVGAVRGVLGPERWRQPGQEGSIPWGPAVQSPIREASLTARSGWSARLAPARGLLRPRLRDSVLKKQPGSADRSRVWRPGSSIRPRSCTDKYTTSHPLTQANRRSIRTSPFVLLGKR